MSESTIEEGDCFVEQSWGFGKEIAGITFSGYSNGSTDKNKPYKGRGWEVRERGAFVKTNYDEITYKIIGVAMSVHNKMGPGLKEAHYQSAMENAMRSTMLNYEPQKQIGVYSDKTLAGLLIIDIFVENMIVVELKALSHMVTNNEIAQMITYLKASGGKIGLLINFGRKHFEYNHVMLPNTVHEFTKKDWRYVYKFKWQEGRFNTKQLPKNISCTLH